MYIFGCDGAEEVYIASADLMTRNTTRRVEVAVPILDGALRSRLLDDFHRMLSDTCKLRVQMNDGSYVRVQSGESRFNAQEYFAEHSYRRAGVSLPEEAGTAAAEERPAPDKASPVEAPVQAAAADAVPELSAQQPDAEENTVSVTVPDAADAPVEAEPVSESTEASAENTFGATLKAIGRKIAEFFE